jgi:hypothetical protein
VSKIRYNDAIAAQPTPRQDAQAARDLSSILRDLDVPDDRIAEGEAEVYDFALRFSAERVREIAYALGNSPAGQALRIALLGMQGQTYDQHAAEVMCDRSNLHRAVSRIERRFSGNCKTGQQGALR